MTGDLRIGCQFLKVCFSSYIFQTPLILRSQISFKVLSFSFPSSNLIIEYNVSRIFQADEPSFFSPRLTLPSSKSVRTLITGTCCDSWGCPVQGQKLDFDPWRSLLIQDILEFCSSYSEKNKKVGEVCSAFHTVKCICCVFTSFKYNIFNIVLPSLCQGAEAYLVIIALTGSYC